MPYDDQSYWDSLNARSPSVSSDRSWICLCCRDTGIVDDGLLRRFFDETRDPSDPGYRCSRSGCHSGARYPPGALLSIDSNKCQMLHTVAIDLQKGAESIDIRARMAEITNKIAKRLPQENRNLASDPILAKDPDSPYFQGEEVDF